MKDYTKYYYYREYSYFKDKYLNLVSINKVSRDLRE